MAGGVESARRPVLSMIGHPSRATADDGCPSKTALPQPAAGAARQGPARRVTSAPRIVLQRGQDPDRAPFPLSSKNASRQLSWPTSPGKRPQPPAPLPDLPPGHQTSPPQFLPRHCVMANQPPLFGQRCGPDTEGDGFNTAASGEPGPGNLTGRLTGKFPAVSRRDLPGGYAATGPRADHRGVGGPNGRRLCDNSLAQPRARSRPDPTDEPRTNDLQARLPLAIGPLTCTSW